MLKTLSKLVDPPTSKYIFPQKYRDASPDMIKELSALSDTDQSKSVIAREYSDYGLRSFSQGHT